MKKNYEQWPNNFGMLPDQNYDRSKVVIFQFPYEGTVSYGVGTKNGPAAIVGASRYLDEMWAAPNGSVSGFRASDVFTLDEFQLSREGPKFASEGVSEAITDFATKKAKFPISLGGEHSITPGVTSALKKKYGNFAVLQIDAHTDLLDQFEGTKYSHACAMRRVLDQNLKVTQVGIRNMNFEVEKFLKENKVKTFFAPEVPVEEIIKTLPQNVYLTVDLDGFDPSIMPSVGTPEPGGLLWADVVGLIRALFKSRNVIGADVVELAPIPGFAAPDFLAAKLVYEIIHGKLVLSKGK